MIYKPLFKQLIILLYSSGLVACAGTSEPSGSGSYADEPAGSDCISQASVRDYKVLDDANLIVNSSFEPENICISSVRRLTPEDEHDLLVQFGKKEPDYTGPRQAEQVDGAEVEELD